MNLRYFFSFPRFSLFLLLLGVIGFRAVAVCSIALHNYAILLTVQTPICDPGSYACVSGEFPPSAYFGNKDTLTQARRYLHKAVEVDSSNAIAWYLLALVELAQGDSLAAYDAYRSSRDLGFTSLLLRPGKTEYHLLRAYQDLAKEKWEQAIREMRISFALAGENVHPKDLQIYNLLLADHGNYKDPVLRAKLFRRGGNDVASIKLLQDYLSETISDEERAAALSQLGWAYWEAGQLETSLQNWQKSVTLSPTASTCYQLFVHNFLNDSTVAQCSRLVQPQFFVGRYGETYQQISPYRSASGAELVGYDLDTELLEIEPEVELILWWHLPPKQNGLDSAVQVGDWWFERVSGINLAPNAGFEWAGEEDNGLPIGYPVDIYRADPGSIKIVHVLRQDEQTDALLLDNTDNSTRRVSVTGPIHPVNPNGLYLIAGWKKEASLTSNIGCLRSIHARKVPWPYTEMGPYYTTQPDRDVQPVNEWIHFASVAQLSVEHVHSDNTAFKDPKNPIICQPFLLNYESKDQALFDNILFIQIADLDQ